MNELRTRARELLDETEKKLRNIIDSIMKEKKSLQWIENPDNGLTLDAINKIKETRDIELHRDKHNLHNLIDYTYIVNLKSIIFKNWSLFSAVFANKQKFEIFMDVLIDSRNNLSHSRELDDYKYNLVIGVCGSINETLEKWKMDFDKKVLSYKCLFILFARDENDQDKVIQQKFDSIMSNLSPKKSEVFEEYLELSFEEGKARISLDKDIAEYSYMSPERELGTAYIKFVTLESNNINIINKILEVKNYPFTRLEILLEDKLDFNMIYEDMKYNGRKAKINMG